MERHERSRCDVELMMVARSEGVSMNRPIVAIGAPPGAPIAAYTAPSELDPVVEAVRALPGDVLLATRDDESRRVARAVRLLLGADRVGLLHTPLPYTAWAATLHVLATMPDDVETSRAGEIAAAVSGTLRTHVVLSSVAALDHPTPTFAQHVRGLLPGALFDVDLVAGAVRRFSGALAVQSSLVVVARSAKALPQGLDDRLPANRLDLGTVDAGWRAARWIEVTALDDERWYAASAVVRRPGAAALCPTCGRRGSAPACLFCEIPLSAGAPASAEPLHVGGLPE
jgi:hypothetical protein